MLSYIIGVSTLYDKYSRLLYFLIACVISANVRLYPVFLS